MKNHEILCVVTGMEHSGTTYLSKILASNPDIMCGFECGILLDDISRFPSVEPWYEWMQISADKGHWGVRTENMTRICSAKDYYDAYHLIKKYSGDIGSIMVKECFRKAKYIIDKTPRYVYCLDLITKKIDVPFIVIQKDICDQYKSYKKRGNPYEHGSMSELYTFIYEYLRCSNSLKRACQQYPDRILTVDYNELLQNKNTVLQQIYQFLNVPFYYQSNVDNFFKRTGLKEKTFTNEFIPRLNSFDHKTPKIELSRKEINILRNLEHSIANPALLRSWITGFFLRCRPGPLYRFLFSIYRYITD